VALREGVARRERVTRGRGCSDTREGVLWHETGVELRNHFENQDAPT
jgi:hypothetical protein